ncbi:MULTISPECIES: hypothetical protein [Ensifer]|uniref:hypothetical protein n=1 Tax=Ensifer TaxID=106591 RepID=UPI00046CD5E5|nr:MULTISPECIES: hypothetical protein [Ensifer]KQU93605.1 hypothetical protein ASD00_23245 [Ensifer sp. Root31]KQW58596.1 hypothetical protein ASD02_06275 [Ensifer sp. Root1252]KQW74299.1 hypothetical protein ASD03_06915 [Ensifer sp. Root127]KQY78571.1 hypothetical protein ASD52_01580 [Ensifer sp. Root142]KRC67430.1 hypothetical protein ASE32_09730 [Ensifer sp. Root231]
MSDVASPQLSLESFAGFEHNCFERHDLRLYNLPVVGSGYLLARWAASRQVRLAWLAYLQTSMLRYEYLASRGEIERGVPDAGIVRLAEAEAARGSPMSPSTVRLALILARRSMPYFNLDHELSELGPLDEAEWTELIDTAFRIDIFLCSRPRFSETLRALPRYPEADLGADGYLFLVNFLSILGLRSELSAGSRGYLQRKINIVLHSLGLNVDALRADLYRVQDEIGRREIPSSRARLEPIDVSIALFETELQAAWELVRTLEVLQPAKARDSGPEGSGQAEPQPQF